MIGVLRGVNLNRSVFILTWCCVQAFTHNLQQIDQSDYHETNVPHQGASSRIHVAYNNLFDEIKAEDEVDTATLDTWSVIWYIASFGGLIVFFLVVSCSEWCCRRTARRNFSRNSNAQAANTMVPETPPPSYDLFAPPDYESIVYGKNGGEKSRYDVFVVPVHALGTIMESDVREEAPPSYHNARAMLSHPAIVSQSNQTT